MTTKYRPGIKNIAAHIFGAVFSGTGLFHMVFIRPLAVGDRAGPTGAEHTRLSVVLAYAAAALVMLYCIYEAIVMVRMRRNLERDLTAKRDMTTEYRATISDIVGRILGALFCGFCLFYFAFIGRITAGDTPRRLVDGATSFPLSSILIYTAFAFLLVYFVYETVMMVQARGKRRPGEGMAEKVGTEHS